MGDFVTQHARHFGFTLRGDNQASVHTDVAAGQRKGVDLRIAHQKKLERLPRIAAARGEAIAYADDVIGDFCVVVKIRIAARFFHDALPQHALLQGR